jgi:hypothetical protein
MANNPAISYVLAEMTRGRRPARVHAAMALVLAAACGHADAPAPPAPRHDPASVPTAPGDAPVELPARALGEPTLAAFAWRQRGGQGEFTAARAAESRGAWPDVAKACARAIATDPLHLEAQWLDAIALAKLGSLDAVVAPLQTAITGDYVKWSEASLSHPALQTWLGTAAGQAWKARVDADRPMVVAALAHALVVRASGDLYAFDDDSALPSGSAARSSKAGPFDGEGQRWYRLTNTFGGVIAALAVPRAHRIAYVVRKRDGRLAIGQVELGRVHTTHPVALGVTATASTPVVVAWSERPPVGFWVGSGGGTQAWRTLDDEGALHPQTAKAARPAGSWLEVHAHTARLHRTAEGVAADWDEHALAGAMRVTTSGRVVTAPSPFLIDGGTVTWANDRAHLAFVAQDPEACASKAPSASPNPTPTPNPTPSPNPTPIPSPPPDSIAYVIDVATGTPTEIARGNGGFAIEWIDDRELAVAGANGVARVASDGSVTTPLPGADALVTPSHPPRCTPEPDSDVTAPSSDAGDDEP